MTLDQLLDEWFRRGVKLYAEFGTVRQIVDEHRHAVLVALDLGLTPPDWPEYLDFMRDE